MRCNDALRLRDVTKSYQGKGPEVLVLRGINLNVGYGETVAIMGASGSGKTTLLSISGGLDGCSSGSVELLGSPLASIGEREMNQMRRTQLGFLLQRPFLMQEMTALENVMIAGVLSGMCREQAKEKSTALLEKVSVEKHAISEKPSVLSPGQAQRVALARALVHTPKCVFCDEPTASVDAHTSSSIMDLLCTLARESGVSVVLATHDQSVANKCGRIITLMNGCLAES